MHFIIPTFLTLFLTITTAAPLQDQQPTATESEPIANLLVHAAPPIVSKISDPEPIPGTVLLVPPPLFDPPEPRPDPLYNSGNIHSQAHTSTNLKSAPVQEFRTETLSSFDGAHVHPVTTPYTPEALPGTCAFYPSCRMVKTSAEIGGTLVLLCTAIYAVIYTLDKIIRRVLWSLSAKTRARSPSGSLRLEPGVGEKGVESQQIPSEKQARRNPLVKVFSEKGVERIVHLV